MTLYLQAPCEGPELTDVLILNSGEMVFPDYDIEHDVVLAEMGEEPTLCADVYLRWESNPLDFICDSGLVPIDLVGRIMTSWCKEAISLTKDELEEMGCYKALVASSKACKSFWTKKKPSLTRVYQSRIDVVNCWNRYARDKKNLASMFHVMSASEHRKYRKVSKDTEHLVVEAAIENILFILDFVNQMESTGGIYKFPTKTCAGIKNEIRNIFYVGLNRYPCDDLDVIINMEEDFKRADDRMFELAMVEIKRYQR